MSREGALWIGGLEQYMDEAFIQTALRVMGEAPPLSIKVMKNKFSDAAAGYGFINFANDQMALTVMHKLNGKMMPNTNPPVRWKLNHSSNRLLPGEKNHSVWVGDLTPEVDDLQLYQFFSKRFQSLVSAKGKLTIKVSHRPFYTLKIHLLAVPLHTYEVYLTSKG